MADLGVEYIICVGLLTAACVHETAIGGEALKDTMERELFEDVFNCIILRHVARVPTDIG